LTIGAEAVPAPRSIEVTDGATVEVAPHPPIGALEEGMTGEVARLYAAGIADVRSGHYRHALSVVRQARKLSYLARQQGPIAPALAQRHFQRIRYLEEQLSDLTPIEEQLERPPEPTDHRNRLLQLKALLLHNLFLAVRGFLGINDNRLLKESVHAYQVALEQADDLKQPLLVGYAAMLAERGSRRDARAVFQKLSDGDRKQENLDIAVAYYYLALGDRQRAIARLITASGRESWLHGPAGWEDRPFRSQVYLMNDFDRLRDHPRFQELVTRPEEQ
jgi:hypothetical protein